MAENEENEPATPDFEADAEARAREVLEALCVLVSDVALDLDVTWTTARELFADSLFQRARDRHGSRTQVAAALDTAKRTVHRYLGPEREENRPLAPTFNMRRRVLHLLERGPMRMEEIEGALPRGSDVNYAKGALKSLETDGLVVQDRRAGTFRRANADFEPWYLRSEMSGTNRLKTALISLGRLLGSRYTPRLEDGADPGVALVFYENLPARFLKEYVDDLYDTLVTFDARWEQVAREHDEERPKHFVGGFFSWGRIGAEIDEEQRRAMLRNDPRMVPWPDEVNPTFQRYQDEEGRYVTLPGETTEPGQEPDGDDDG